MVLLFTTPIGDVERDYFGLPARSILHGILFWGFAHLWLGAFKKQSKYETIKRNSFLIVLISAITVAIVAEVSIYLGGLSPQFSFWNLGFDLLGTVIGMFMFRLLYASCY